jgi:hypothetical protein
MVVTVRMQARILNQGGRIWLLLSGGDRAAEQRWSFMMKRSGLLRELAVGVKGLVGQFLEFV